MNGRFYLDPLEGEREYPSEPIYANFIDSLTSGGEYRLAAGHTELQPAHPLTVGCRYDFSLTYFPDDEPLAAGAVVAFSIPRTWTQPQVEAPGPGFVSVEASHGTARVARLTTNTNLQWWIVIEAGEGGVPAGGRLRAHYRNVTIQRFPQEWWGNWRSGFRTAVDSKGAGQYAFVPAVRTAKPVVEAAPAARLYVAAPAVARPGETVSVRFSALDYCDNRANPAPAGDIFAARPDAPFVPVAQTELHEKDRGCGSIEVTAPEGAEAFHVVVSNRRDNLRGVGAATVVDPSGELPNVYFGDIHAKTMLSDGLKTPMEYFEHARDVALTDFGAIADHNFEEASRLEGPFVEGMSDEAFAEIQKACEACNEPGRFVTLQSFEQNRIADYKGHRNIYFRGVCPGLFRGKTLDELYDYLDGHKALAIPHHTIIWKTRPHLDNPRYERVVEMYSTHCSSEVKGTAINNYETTPSKAETGVSAREMLDGGYRLGFIAASDNHNGAPGLSARPSRFTNLVYSGGLAAVLAPQLTREAVFDALYDRRCYATTGTRIYLDFRLAGRVMGSEIEAERGATLPYEITVSATDAVACVELVSNGREEVLWRHDGRSVVSLQGKRTFTDETNWIYVRVTQADRHMAWSSPVWVDTQ